MYDLSGIYTGKTVQEVIRILKENPDARMVAGGTDLLVALRHHKIRNPYLVNIREVEELHGIRLLDNGDLWIGPGTEFDTLYRDPLAREKVSMLAEACNMVGSPQIRHIGTVGGNLCNGAVSADTAPAFLAYGAQLTIENSSGMRCIPVTELHTGPGKTQLEHDEILTEIIIPRENYEGWYGCYLKFGQRNAMEISTLGVAALVKLSEDRQVLEGVKMSFGVAAPKPVRVTGLEKDLTGKRIDEDLYSYVKEHVMEELNPRDSWRASREFREQLIRTQSVRALQNAIKAAGGEEHV